MTAFRYKIKFPEPVVEEGKETPEKPDDFFIVVIAPNGETAKNALKQQFPQPDILFEYESQTDAVIQAQ